jgi:hypothetical protein
MHPTIVRIFIKAGEPESRRFYENVFKALGGLMGSTTSRVSFQYTSATDNTPLFANVEFTLKDNATLEKLTKELVSSH